jgi:trk system potassium uptake protein TrkA
VVPNVLEYIELSRDFSIVEIPAPEAFVGKSLRELGLRSRYGLTLIALKRQTDRGLVTNIAPGADDRIQASDVLALLGSHERLAELDRLRTTDKEDG